MPDDVGNHPILLLNILGEAPIEAPGEGVQERRLARAIRTEDQCYGLGDRCVKKGRSIAHPLNCRKFVSLMLRNFTE